MLATWRLLKEETNWAAPGSTAFCEEIKQKWVKLIAILNEINTAVWASIIKLTLLFNANGWMDIEHFQDF